MKVSQVSPKMAEKLLGSMVEVLHIKSEKVYPARVVDFCFEGQTGFIFHLIGHNGASNLRKLQKSMDDVTTLGLDDTGDKSHPIVVDARDVFDGDKFAMVKPSPESLAEESILPKGA